jgi:hypothetical protein
MEAKSRNLQEIKSEIARRAGPINPFESTVKKSTDCSSV